MIRLSVGERISYQGQSMATIIVDLQKKYLSVHSSSL